MKSICLMSEVCMKKIAIVGGGASGLFGAILLKKYVKEEIEVTLFEKMSRVGKKLLATGNGKCNLTNLYLDSALYNHILAKQIVEAYPPTKIMEELHALGLMMHRDITGRVYPITDSANTVLDIFLSNLAKYQVLLHLDEPVVHITKQKNFYQIHTKKGKYAFDIVILATGGAASSFLGSNGEGYTLAKELGMDTTPIMPGLVGLQTRMDDVRGLNGLRQKVTLIISKKNQILFQENGEVQFKEDGISGIVVMNASRYLLRNKHDYKIKYDYKIKSDYQIELDLLPEVNVLELRAFLENYDMVGVLPKMLALKIQKQAKTINEQLQWIKHYPITIQKSYGLERAQVTLGGIDCEEVNDALESKINQNLYIIGELLDVDGPCGGYNLHFAFASAKHVVDHIIKKIG